MFLRSKRKIGKKPIVFGQIGPEKIDTNKLLIHSGVFISCADRGSILFMVKLLIGKN